ncbi:hypothetical protein BFJ63_vAg16405 [Fusarium oxysporum f. sp. narcissi]|uniref:Uncharacterized protein n=1 Tax=Fusarium oxysporum f. sp. narcissi TaxID=451672 RepID=A0A4Q2V7J6_FUSOX|nr:hypothetical protein BFJ63_vAg16405 [Fusarium oxysporum f. sp. narcissi]
MCGKFVSTVTGEAVPGECGVCRDARGEANRSGAEGDPGI